LDLRLPVRAPYAAEELLRFLAAHLVPGVEASGPDWYERTLDLPHGAGRVRITLPGDGRVDEGADDGAHDGVDDGAHDGAHDGVDGPGSESAPTGVVQLRCLLQVQDLRDVGAAVERCRRLLDADCDPVAVSEELSGDPWLAGLVRHRPGLRVPGAVDGPETAVRAVLGQQISLLGAVSLGGKLVAAYGRPVPRTDADSPATGATGPDRLFPRPEDLAEVDPQRLPMVRARAHALVGLCAALAAGEVPLDRSADRAEVRRRLLALPGIGPWTADYVALRALGDPDVFLPTDLGVRRALAARGVDPASTDELSRGWRPWRSYALLHLWSTLELPVARPRPTPMKET
ncbi:MAG: AlkA N-terminal domain-containing protein, partial [Nocardioidaceae bacterium]